MINRRFILETGALIAAAALCAAVSNGLAAKDRKVKWIQSNEAPARAARVTAPESTSTTATATEMNVVPMTAPVTTTSQPVPAAATTAGGPAIAPDKPMQQTATAPAQSKAPAPAPAVAQKSFPPHPDKPYVDISPEDAKYLYDQGAIFFDARRTSVFEEGHIKGARHISVWEADLDEKINKLYEENLDPTKPIVVYCSGGECTDSHMLSERLWGIGLNAVYVYKDGYPDWVKKGYPTGSGAATR